MKSLERIFGRTGKLWALALIAWVQFPLITMGGDFSPAQATQQILLKTQQLVRRGEISRFYESKFRSIQMANGTGLVSQIPMEDGKTSSLVFQLDGAGRALSFVDDFQGIYPGPVPWLERDPISLTISALSFVMGNGDLQAFSSRFEKVIVAPTYRIDGTLKAHLTFYHGGENRGDVLEVIFNPDGTYHSHHILKE